MEISIPWAVVGTWGCCLKVRSRQIQVKPISCGCHLYVLLYITSVWPLLHFGFMPVSLPIFQTLRTQPWLTVLTHQLVNFWWKDRPPWHPVSQWSRFADPSLLQRINLQWVKVLCNFRLSQRCQRVSCGRCGQLYHSGPPWPGRCPTDVLGK